MTAPEANPGASIASSPARELVVLVHGIGSPRWLLWPLGRQLKAAGYATRTWGYFSVRGSNRTHGAALAKELQRLADQDNWERIHLAVHSMGSIVTRCALMTLADAPLEKMGRVVMVGPPNRGSHAATRLRRLGELLCPTLVELTDHPESFVNKLPPAPAHVDIGVLALERDKLIYLEQTHLAGQRDHLVVGGMHLTGLWTRETARQAAYFLAHGEFDRRQVGAKDLAAGH